MQNYHRSPASLLIPHHPKNFYRLDATGRCLYSAGHRYRHLSPEAEGDN